MKYKSERGGYGILNSIFISNNMKRTKMILNNKLNNLKENIDNKKQTLKVKIKFLDNAIKINSMLRLCNKLSSDKIFKILIQNI